MSFSDSKPMSDKPYGIYIHIPFCKAKCKYCAFSSITDLSLADKYTEAVAAEIRNAPESGSKADTVYFGGGTPSCLPHGSVAKLLTAVRDSFDVSDTAEITVEANPESCNVQFAEECLNTGVNRISMGLQSASDAVLREIGRIHDRGGFIKAAKLLKNLGFGNVSSDLILGLPLQDKYDIDDSISIISEYCRHASVYALSVEEGTELDRIGYAPDDDFVADLYDRARVELADKGFSRYEVSNFARDGMIGRHNVKYWRCDPYLGFGAAAHGYDGDSTRYRHTDSVSEYIADSKRFFTRLSETDKFNEYIMLRLRTEDGISQRDFLSRFGYDIAERNPSLDRLIADGSIAYSGGRYFIPPDKMFVMNGIIVELMR